VSSGDLIKLATHRALHTGRTFYVIPSAETGKVRSVPPKAKWTGIKVIPLRHGEVEQVEVK
jgi:hypothetical protein